MGKHGFTEQYLCRLERRWDSEKFILAYRENKLIGVHGTLSPTIVKGVCSICQTITNVSMFLATTKSGGDGTYTKKAITFAMIATPVTNN